MPEDLDRRIAELEEVLTGSAADDPETRSVRMKLAAGLSSRYIEHQGVETDCSRADEILSSVLADADATAEQRQQASVARVALRIGRGTVAHALRGRSWKPNMDLLRETEKWRRDADPDAVETGIADVLTAIADVHDLESLPPDLRASLEVFRTLAPLLGSGADEPDAAEVLAQAVGQATPAMPGLDLLRATEAWLRPTPAPGRIAELEEALTGLSEDHLLTPILRRDLAQALVKRSDQHGPEGLARVTQLMEQAAAGMPEDHPFYGETVRTLAGALVASAATDATEDSLARAEQVAAQVLAQARDSGSTVAGPELFLRSMVGLLRGHADGEDHPEQAFEDLVEALEVLPAGHDLRPAAVGQLAALLSDRHLREGLVEDAEAARHLLDRATSAVAADDDDGSATFLSCLGAISRVIQALGAKDDGSVSAAAATLQDSLDRLPAQHVMRPNAELVLTLAKLRLATSDGGDIRAGLGGLRGLLTGGRFPGIPEGVIATMSDTVEVLDGLMTADAAAMVNGINRMEQQVAAAAAASVQQAGQQALLAKAYLAAHDAGVDPEVAADRAVDHLEGARQTLERHRAGVAMADVLRELAHAYRKRGDLEPARRTAFEALAVHAGTVLLQTGVGHAVVTARGATAEAAALAAWCLDDGEIAGAVQAVELGRGLALHAATSALAVSGLLRRIGRSDLAAAWEADSAARRDEPAPWAATGDPAGAGEPDHARAATDLRHKVLAVLRGTTEGGRLFTPPAPAEIADALTAVGADALVYLLPGAGDRDGYLLVVDQDGVPTAVPAPALRIQPGGPPERFSRVVGAKDKDARAAAIADVCAWAGEAVFEPLRAALGTEGRPARVVLVPSGVLGVVPWPAARLLDGRPAIEEFVLSSAASARQFLDTASRAALPLHLEPVLVTEPLGDLTFAADEVISLRDAFYPDAKIFGDLSAFTPSEGGDAPATGIGTPEEVLANLPGDRSLGASMLHLACHARNAGAVEASYLELTRQLTIKAVLEHAAGRAADTPGPLVVLSTCLSDLTEQDYDEALTLATAFVAAGAVTVVGSRWPVDDQATAAAMFAFHHFLAREAQDPAHALRSAQLWMLDAGRAELPEMPEAMLGDLEECDLTEVTVWAAFACHGR
ncbi:CHAT domain-containing protein [Amycolatopsis sp. NPDC005961]|uniref:CHAT domain-containing protein n=1 Tax=Amycolatopsis sp. NPDC005961 TaxID=3156720 RepID=UPI0033F0A57E